MGCFFALANRIFQFSDPAGPQLLERFAPWLEPLMRTSALDFVLNRDTARWLSEF